MRAAAKRGARAALAVSAAGLAATACGPRGGPPACGPGAAVAAPESGGRLAALDGACVSRRALAEWCEGEGETRGETCAVHACEAGAALDPRTFACLPARTVRAMAAAVRTVPADATLACRDGAALVATGDHVACLPASALCPRTAEWVDAKAACVARAPCRAGSVRGAPGEACVAVVSAGPPRGAVDVARWARAVLGPDGGRGSARVCASLGREPWAFDVGFGGSRAVALSVQLVFPDNDVTQVALQVDARDAEGASPVSPAGSRLAERTVASLLAPLRALGGSGPSGAASVSTRITCPIAGGALPRIVPGSSSDPPEPP